MDWVEFGFDFDWSGAVVVLEEEGGIVLGDGWLSGDCDTPSCVDVAWAEVVRGRSKGAPTGEFRDSRDDCARARLGALQFARVMHELFGRLGARFPNSFFYEAVTLD